MRFLRLRYLQSGDDYKPSFSEQKQAEKETKQHGREPRVSFFIPLFRPDLRKVICLSTKRRGQAVRNLAEICSSQRPSRQLSHTATLTPELQTQQGKRYVTPPGKRSAVTDSTPKAEVGAAPARAGAITLSGDLSSRENLT